MLITCAFTAFNFSSRALGDLPDLTPIGFQVTATLGHRESQGVCAPIIAACKDSIGFGESRQRDGRKWTEVRSKQDCVRPP
jgi:hypothetical protein